MNTTYEALEAHFKDLKSRSGRILEEIDDILVEARDEKGKPIYLTKVRTKTIESIYLKLKRKKIQDINMITDFLGIRVLFLFKQDLIEMFPLVLSLLKEKPLLQLKTVRFFNWHLPGEDQRNFKIFKQNVKEKYSGRELEVISIEELDLKMPFEDRKIYLETHRRTSGYKSIHLIYSLNVGGPACFVEIQLRTLLQDVWSELEHALSYKKGNIHPHIKQSFLLLARDLETNDNLMTHLKDISDREHAGQMMALEHGGPMGYFWYDPDEIPHIFRSDPRKKLFEDYYEIMRHMDPRFERGSLQDAIDAYQKIRGPITEADKTKDPEAKYFIEVEEAYLTFWKREYQLARDMYKLIVGKFKDRYVPHFRLGEINLILGNIVDALASFDESERLMGTSGGPENQFTIKIKMAYIYWMLGQEYIDFAINMTQEAEKIYDEHKEKIDVVRQGRLKPFSTIINNYCAYYLDSYMFGGNEESYQKIPDKLDILEKLIREEEAEEAEGRPNQANANMYDTAAWCNYQMYLKERDLSFLKKAVGYSDKIEGRINFATLRMTSHSMQHRHMKEIRMAKNRAGI